MSTPATELQKLLELRDAGELTAAEFETAKARILAPQRPRRARGGSWDPFSSFGRGVLTIIVALGVLIGGTTLLTLTEAGMAAIGVLVILVIAVVAVMLFMALME